MTKDQENTLIAIVENKIIAMLEFTYTGKMEDGYCGWYVPSHYDFIAQFANLNPLEMKFIKEASDSLIKKKYINVNKEEEAIFIELTDDYYLSKIKC